MPNFTSNFFIKAKLTTKQALSNNLSPLNITFALLISSLFLLSPFISINIVAFGTAFFSIFLLLKKPGLNFSLKDYLILGLMAAFVGSTFISSYALSTSTQHGLSWGLLWLSCFLAGFIFSKINPQHNYFFIAPVVFVLIVTFLICMLCQYLELTDAFFYKDFPQRLTIFLLYPFRLAVFGAFCALYCLNLVVQSQNRLLKTIYFFSLFLLLLIIALTYYKNPLVILVFIFIISLALIPGAKKIKVITLSVFLVAAILFLLSISKEQRRFLSVIIDNPTEHSTILSRMPLWYIGKELFLQSPYFGHGLKSYQELHPKYVQAHQKELKEKYTRYEPAMRHSHNFILSRLVEGGLVGCTLFLMLFITTVLYAFKAPKEQRWLACFFIFYFLVGIIDDPLVRTNDAYIFILMGLVLGGPKNNIVNQPKKICV